MMAPEPAADAAPTLVELFVRRVRLSGARPALYVLTGTRPSELSGGAVTPCGVTPAAAGRFQSVSWDELASDVRRVAVVLAGLISPGDRVAQVSGNRYLWIVIDLAIQLARGVHVALHNALSMEQMLWQIADSEASLVLGAADAPLLAPDAKAAAARQTCAARWMSDDELARLAAAVPVEAALVIEQQALASVGPGDLATILYTSGTTGEPKGVMLSQGNLASNAQAALQAFRVRHDDLRLCWLPLSHIYARTSDLYVWLAEGHVLGLAQSRDTLVTDMWALRPTVINGVPYFYDKLRRHLVSQGRGDEPGALQALLGGQMRLCCAGGAALPDHVAEFFAKQGVLLVQGYGLTESSPVISTCTPEAHRLGTVGRPIPGVEVRIAEDGEILTRGPHVMLGYWKRPAATAEVLRDGWLHTGDLGTLEDGYLRITGRKKELLVLASGKKVAPILLESRLTADPLFSQAVVLGDGRNYVTALLVCDADELRRVVSHGAREAAAQPAGGAEQGADAVAGLLSGRVATCLAGLSEWEQVRKFALLDRPLSIEAGELTPTLKLRRDVIYRHFSAEIERLYGEEATG